MENNVTDNSRSGRIWAGLFVLGIGFILLMDRMGAGLPWWLFRWPVILIAIGAFLGLRHGFRGGAWLILIVIGSIFLTDMIAPGLSLKRYFWPIIIMLFGLIMILKPKGNRNWRGPEPWRQNAHGREGNSDINTFESTGRSQFVPMEVQPKAHMDTGDYLESTAIFGGDQKIIFYQKLPGR